MKKNKKREVMCEQIICDYLESFDYQVQTFEQTIEHEGTKYEICIVVATAWDVDGSDVFSDFSFEGILKWYLEEMLNTIEEDIKEYGECDRFSKEQINFIKKLKKD